MRSLKAYPGGNDPLCSIHELDITDKHIAMLETRSLGLMPDVVGAINIINTVFGPLNDGKGFIGGLSSGFVSA